MSTDEQRIFYRVIPYYILFNWKNPAIFPLPGSFKGLRIVA